MADIRISNRKNLLVKAFVFGYPLRGESILVLFIDKQYNRILYSIVIDSFKYRGVNKTVDIMSSFGLEDQKINMLIWSHPDYDHTYGIDSILNKFCDANTMVVLPLGINGHEWHKVSYNKDDKKIMEGIINLTNRKKYSHQTISVCNIPQGIIKMDFYDYMGTLPVTILALSPHGGSINQDTFGPKKMMHKNDFSISIMIEVGSEYKYKLLFMADTENKDIDLIDCETIKDPVFIKIPHHTSSTSNHLLYKLLEERPYISCTTVYKNHKLPEKKLLGFYKDISLQSDCTGFAEENEKLFGYIEYIFDFFDEKKISVRHKGHARIVDDAFLDSIPY